MNALHKLDNPAWFALAETHAKFAVGNAIVKRYQPHVVAFAAYDYTATKAGSFFDEWITGNESFFLVGNVPALPANYEIKKVYPCWQMVCTTAIIIPPTVDIIKLEQKDETAMYDLVNLVQPGFYKPGTRLMGDYYGVFQEGQLVAMAGERICMNEYTEISAVVTHPNYTGRQYAQQLIAKVANKNREQGITPMLHVAQTNTRAIKLYEYLGFVTRSSINFTKIKRLQ